MQRFSDFGKHYIYKWKLFKMQEPIYYCRCPFCCCFMMLLRALSIVSHNVPTLISHKKDVFQNQLSKVFSRRRQQIYPSTTFRDNVWEWLYFMFNNSRGSYGCSQPPWIHEAFLPVSWEKCCIPSSWFSFLCLCVRLKIPSILLFIF